jgi:hypothetical protein
MIPKNASKIVWATIIESGAAPDFEIASTGLKMTMERVAVEIQPDGAIIHVVSPDFESGMWWDIRDGVAVTTDADYLFLADVGKDVAHADYQLLSRIDRELGGVLASASDVAADFLKLIREAKSNG